MPWLDISKVLHIKRDGTDLSIIVIHGHAVVLHQESQHGIWFIQLLRRQYNLSRTISSFLGSLDIHILKNIEHTSIRIKRLSNFIVRIKRDLVNQDSNLTWFGHFLKILKGI
jgi:hypothetical protein